MFDQLLAHPGVEEVVHIGSRFGVMAFHGGNLERGTDQIAECAARLAGASLYVVRQPDDLRWHVPSAEVRPECSTALARFLDHVARVVAVHGYGRQQRFFEVMLGGRNRLLAATLGRELRARLAHYTVVDDLALIPPELRGQHPANPVNVPTGGGVQVELPPRIRGQGPRWRHWPDGEITPPGVAVAEAIAALA